MLRWNKFASKRFRLAQTTLEDANITFVLRTETMIDGYYDKHTILACFSFNSRKYGHRTKRRGGLVAQAARD